MKALRIVAVIYLAGFVVFAEPALCDWQKVTDENGGSATIDTGTIATGPNGVSANICVDRNNEGKCQTTRVIFNCRGRVSLGILLFGKNAPPESLEGKLAAIACAKRSSSQDAPATTNPMLRDEPRPLQGTLQCELLRGMSPEARAQALAECKAPCATWARSQTDFQFSYAVCVTKYCPSKNDCR
jgi:hypothetical protein